MPRTSPKNQAESPNSKHLLNHFLVMGRSVADDVPLRSFRTAKEAYEYGASVIEQHLHEEIRRVYGMSSADFYHVTVVEFRGGVPGETKIVRSFE